MRTVPILLLVTNAIVIGIGLLGIIWTPKFNAWFDTMELGALPFFSNVALHLVSIIASNPWIAIAVAYVPISTTGIWFLYVKDFERCVKGLVLILLLNLTVAVFFHGCWMLVVNNVLRRF